MDDLTKDQQFLLVSLYREYLNRQPALDPSSANYFVDSDSLIPLLGLGFSPEYVGDMCLALFAAVQARVPSMNSLFPIRQSSTWKTDSKTAQNPSSTFLQNSNHFNSLAAPCHRAQLLVPSSLKLSLAESFY